MAPSRQLAKVSEALEAVERVHGYLYDMHQTVGRADLLVRGGHGSLDANGHNDLARSIRRDVIGCNVLPGCWTFQIVEEFDHESRPG